MRKIISALLSVTILLSVCVFPINTMVASSAIYINFDDEDEDTFLPEVHYQSGGNYNVANMLLSEDFDNTTGAGKSMKAEGRTALNDRMKFMNIFTPEDIGTKYKISLWVYIPDLEGVELSFGVYGARGTANTAKQAATVTKIISKDTWTKVEFEYEHLDELNTQIGIEQKKGEIASTIYIDDIMVLPDGVNAPIPDGTQDGEEGEPATIPDEYKDIIEKFKSLGLCETFIENFNPETGVTRGAFASVMSEFAGDNVVISNSEKVYSDVLDSNEYADKIYTMTNLKYMQGFPDGTFKPNDVIYAVDALKVMCIFLGYDIYADAKGGYPSGYLITSSEIDLTDGVGVNMQSTLTSGDFLKLLDNFISIDILEQSQFGTTSKYKAEKGITILAKNLDIYCDNGRVNANFKTSIDSKAALSKTQIRIDNNLYNTVDTDAHDYLGYYVDYYYTNTNNTVPDLLYAYLPSDSYNEITINEEDKLDIRNGRLYYVDESKREKSVRIEFDADAIYNGVNTTYEDSLIEDLTDGFVKFLDADMDGTYETIFINDISYLVVESVSSSIDTIYFKYDKDPISSAADDAAVPYIIKDIYGDKVELNSLKEWYVLSVIKSADTDATEVTVVNNSVSGVIKSVKKSDDGLISEITIGEDTYKVTNTTKNLISDEKIETPAPGENVILYLNENGYVVTWRYNSVRSGMLGYIYDAGIEDTGTRRLCLEMVCDNGKFEKYELAEKVKFNGVSTKYKDIDVTQFYTNDNAVRQLVHFDINSEGYISELNTALDADNLEEGKLTQTCTAQSGYVKRGVINYFATPGNTSASTIYSIGDDVVAFKIPEDAEYAAKEEYYSVSKGDVTVIPTYPVVSDIYTFTGSYNLCDVIVYRSQAQKVVNVSTGIPTIITSISDVLYDDDEIYKQVTGINNGKEVSFLYEDLREGTPTATLSVGDIVLYSTDEKGFVRFKGAANALSSTNTSIRMLVNYNETSKDITTGYNFSSGSMSTISNTFAVYSISDGYIYLNPLADPGNTKPLQAYKYSDFTVYKFNKRTLEFEEVSAQEAETYERSTTGYSKAYIFIKGTKPNIMVLYW